MKEKRCNCKQEPCKMYAPLITLDRVEKIKKISQYTTSCIGKRCIKTSLDKYRDKYTQNIIARQNLLALKPTYNKYSSLIEN